MKAGAIVCFILAALAGLVAIKNVFGGGPNAPTDSNQFAGYAVGSFIIPIALVIGGVMLWNKSQQ